MAEVSGNQTRDLVTRWMIDTSALGQRSNPDVHTRLASCISEGAAVCDMVVAESLIRARSSEGFEARKSFFAAFDVLPVDERVWSDVNSIAELLANSDDVVAPSHVIIAACASVHGLVVLHYDSDYETLGRRADISHEWVAPKGSL